MHNDDNRVVQHGNHTPNNRLTETCLGLPCASLILDIKGKSMNTCQNKVSADQYHLTKFKFTAHQSHVLC